MQKNEFLIVGSGLTGAVIARSLADAGKEVLVLERRNHLGGNVHDTLHPSGISYHTYGPHYFRTSSEAIWKFVNRFATFHPFEACLLAKVGDEHVPWPLWRSWISKRIGNDWKASFVGEPTNFEEAALRLMPREVYELFIKEYNEKQWGVAPSTLAAELCRRFDVRETDEPRLKPEAKYQGIPECGYAGWMKNMLWGIEVRTGVDYLAHRDQYKAGHIFYTGPIDEFFSYEFGRLQYRGQKREHQFFENLERYQPACQVNYPLHEDGPSIRSLEWKQMMPTAVAKDIPGTLVTWETPFSPTDPDQFEYPFPDQANREMYQRYEQKAATIPNLTVCGRLGEYRYYDMDQAIGRAMRLVSQHLISV